VCDGTFFPTLLKEMSAVVGCFNNRAQKLLELHLASGFRKYFIWFKAKLQNNHVTLIQEGKDLVTYALINSVAIRKILKKYDKVYLFRYVKCKLIFRICSSLKLFSRLLYNWDDMILTISKYL
jgi:SPX domain protein involved in polyphosphate accumulation